MTTLFPCVLEFSAAFSLLLTGTPVQNGLGELYALLALLEPGLFPREQAEEFVQRYRDIEREPEAGRWPGSVSVGGGRWSQRREARAPEGAAGG